MDISVGDLITRKSYEHDTVFRVIAVNERGFIRTGMPLIEEGED